MRRARWTNRSDEVVHIATFPRVVRRASGGSSAAGAANAPVVRAKPIPPRVELQESGRAQQHYSVRIGRGYRALGKVIGSEIIWSWIGSHADYDKLI